MIVARMYKSLFCAIESILSSNALTRRHVAAGQALFASIWPYRLLRLGLAAVFIWSGITKLIEPQIFAVLIDSYGLIPETWTPFISFSLPLLEVVAGIGLLFDLNGTLATITILLMIFICILGYGIHMGLDVDCGCFGPDDPESKAYHGLRAAIYRDVLMLAVIVYLYAWRYRNDLKLQRFKDL